MLHTIRIVNRINEIPADSANTLYLLPDSWDDWGTFRNKYYVIYYTHFGNREDLGYIKIGCPLEWLDDRRPILDAVLPALPQGYYALGQSGEYYQRVRDLGPETARDILTKLNDVVWDRQLYLRHQDDQAMRDSLQRYVSRTTIEGQFRNILQGRAALTEFHFTYQKQYQPLHIDFDVYPESVPPTNIHVLIGSNGVGKSTILNEIADIVVGRAASEDANIYINDGSIFANVIAMSFGAFEKFNPQSIERRSQNQVTYSYIGSKKITELDGETLTIGKTMDDFFNEFYQSLQACRYEPKKTLFLNCVEHFRYDPILAALALPELLAESDDRQRLHAAFNGLSSGHKIVVLSVAKIIEVIEEKTLLLIDEPETHLHPPLLSALIRLLSTLLAECNGAAIIATHSPVVLQETPKRCVTVLYRDGDTVTSERPERETFGENVSVLTRSAFNLELSRTGYVNLIQQMVDEYRYFDKIYRQFGEELGSEALAILSALSDDEGDI